MNKIHREYDWTVYLLNDKYGEKVNITSEFISKYERIMDEFEQLQDELEQLHNMDGN